jgi:PPOX class probable F420-dependent enzyme
MTVAYTMSSSEVRDFLSDGTRTAKVATVRPDGRPHVAPVWFVLADADNAWGFELIFMTGSQTVKGRDLQRSPYVALTVDDERPPYAFVLVEGETAVSDSVAEMLPWATKIGGRYMGAENAERFGQRNSAPGELLVRVRPTNVIGQGAIAD